MESTYRITVYLTQNSQPQNFAGCTDFDADLSGSSDGANLEFTDNAGKTHTVRAHAFEIAEE